MDKKYTVIFDSGIGGLNVLLELTAALPGENLIYVGDNANAPYGNRPTSELLNLTLQALAPALIYNVQSIVLGCNTLSVCIRDNLQSLLGVPVHGVYPPVDTSLQKGGNVLLLATNRTAEYFIRLYAADDRLYILPLAGLASEIEKGAKESVEAFYRPPFSNRYKKHYINITLPFLTIDTLILGCTHYNFIKNQLFDHFKPHSMTSGIPLTVQNYIKWKKSTVFIENTLKTIQKGEIIFMGKNAEFNRKVFYEALFRGEN